MNSLHLFLYSLFALVNQTLSSSAKLYINDNGPLQLSSTINIKNGFSLKFRTCSSGQLLYQGGIEKFFAVTLYPTTSISHSYVVLSWKYDNSSFNQTLGGHFSLDRNSIVEIEVSFTNAERPVFRILTPQAVNYTSSTLAYLINASNPGPLLLGMRNFKGCLYDGQNINMSTAVNKSNFQTGCPLEDQRPCSNRVCPPGFGGRFCDMNINECGSYPCHSHATCVDGFNSYTCVCGPQWTGRTCSQFLGSICASSPCKNGGHCYDSKDKNNYTCTCPQGYTGRNCDDIFYPCSSNPCMNGAVCFNYTIGSSNEYNCTCQKGFTGVNCEHNIDDCISYPCHNGKCIDGINNYTCDCNGTGFRGQFCHEDINECTSVMPCRNNATCENLYGGYKCLCSNGFTGSTCETDILECKKHPCLNNGTCDELYGTYQCNCMQGFTGQRCEINIDDCIGNVCGGNGSCIDGINNYTCNCSVGFSGRHCEINIDECKSNPCLNNGTCEDAVNGYKCKCLGAFNGSRCEAWRDLCNPSPCTNNGTCLQRNDSVTGYECNCTGTGYAGPKCQFVPGFCYPHNPCVHGECRDNGTTYNCICNQGYEGRNCSVDIDECISSPCKFSGQCRNQPGTYSCVCTPYSTGKNCETDVFRCDPACLNGGQCSNRNGTKDQCLCGSPWIGDYCQKRIDFCAQDKPFCGNGICQNYYGVQSSGTVCVCNAGYTGNNCTTDVDECRLGYCKNNISCTNLRGDYNCSCLPGFTNKNCTQNINECSSNPCRNNGTCQDQTNGYRCICRYGYNGTHCENDIDWCASNPCQNGANCTDGIETFNCSCYLGYSGKRCEIDINECISNPCQYSGICIERSNATALKEHGKAAFELKSRYGYVCSCPQGTNGTNCENNIDDCASKPCLNNATCHDLLNGYNCTCPHGFTGKNCSVNINECESGPCLNNATCKDLVGGFQCICKTNYTGIRCENATNQCNIRQPCMNGGTCYQVGTGYRCVCANGFTGLNCKNSTTVNFNGNGYLTFNSSSANITFRFRTTLTNVILCQIMAQSKHVSIGIVQNGLTIIDSSGKSESIIVDGLQNGVWHTIDVIADGSVITISINGKTHRITSFGIAQINKYFFGGLSSSIVIKNPESLSGFIGCIEDIKIGNSKLDPSQGAFLKQATIGNCVWKQVCGKTPCKNGGKCNDLWNTYSCKCNRRYFGAKCKQVYEAFSFGAVAAAIKPLPTSTPSNSTSRRRRSISTQISNDNNRTDYVLSIVNTTFDSNTTISMSVRTRSNDGILFVLSSTAPNRGTSYVQSFVSLQMVNGVLFYTYKYNSESITSLIKTTINDGSFHDIEVSKQNLTVDDILVYSPSVNSDLPVKFLFVGGVDNITFFRTALNTTAQYSGCLQAIRFKGSTISTTSLSSEGGPTQSVNSSTAKPGCNGTDVCAVNPCKNSGNCTDLWNAYNCTCAEGFSGVNCTLFGCALHNTCPSNTTCFDLMPGTTTCVAPVTFNGNQSIAMFNNLNISDPSTISFSLRTRRSDSFILGSVKNASHFLTIGLTGGKIAVIYQFYGMAARSSLSGRVQVNDGSFHTVELKTSSVTTITIDSILDTSNNSNVFGFQWKALLINLGLQVGKSSTPQMTSLFSSSSFKGCIEKLLIGHQLLKFQESKNVSIRTGCHSDAQCVSNPCLRGSCQDTFDSFRCVCPPYYTGKLCNTTVNLTCAVNPCSNVSSCVNITSSTVRVLSQSGVDKFRCDCNIGYQGYLCDSEVNECSLNPCTNGNCTDLLADYKCTCKSGYTGKNCTININDCISNPCKNGGKCIDHINYYSCDCPSNFTGKNCSEDVNECLNKPCMNNGTCSNYFGRYNCSCKNGSFGHNCQYNATMQCSSNPCRNGATCTASNAGYKCQCRNGFTGKLCDNDTNPCQSSPCKNSGTCVPVLGQCPNNVPNCVQLYVSYNCTCLGQWMGQTCTLVNPCSSSPCKNSGSCSVNGTNVSSPKFICTCSDKFEGEQCQTAKPTKKGKSEVNIGLWIGIAAAVLVILILILLACRFCNREQGMHGNYSPSKQEKGQVELAALPPLPPKERLI